jgi:LysR family cys regulon transcriptional activator
VKLQQLRVLAAVAQNDLNLTAAAAKLHTTQPAVSKQLKEMAELDRIDFIIATGSKELFRKQVLLPCYQWHRRSIVPRDHPLAGVHKPTVDELAAYPLVTYVFSFTGPSSLQETFAGAGLKPKVALTHDLDRICAGRVIAPLHV